MSLYITLLNGLAVTWFGGILSAAFCSGWAERRSRWIFFGAMAVIPVLQGAVFRVWDVQTLRQIYPVMVHLPLILLLFWLTRKVFWSVVSVLTAYLCCQLRRWFALVCVALCSGDAVLREVIELVITLPLLLFLLWFVAPAVRKIGDYPLRMQMQFAAVPALYYGFDYVSVVYSRLLFNGNMAALEFMPFVCCVSYLVFLLYSVKEERKRSNLEQTQKILNMQLFQSVQVITSLRESQELIRQYRHDLRHHLQYVSSCMENGQIETAQEYISGICEEIERQKIERYCENEAVNLIMSAFAARAKRDGITLRVKGNLPSVIMASDSDLCVVLSNALENAMNTCRLLAESEKERIIDVQYYSKENRIYLQIINPCRDDILFENGIPVTTTPGHGIGVQSICAVVQRYGGVYSFSTENGCFILRLTL